MHSTLMKILNHFLLLAASAACGNSMFALDVTVSEPGTLSSLIADSSTTSSLIVDGNVNASDLYFIGRLPALTELDLTNAVIADNTIPLGAFAACTTLKTASVPAGVTIEGYVFSDCTSLESVNLNGATVIPEYTFRGCTSLTSYTFDANIQTIGEGAFYGSGLTNLDLTGATALTSVGKAAFADCKSLTSVTFDADAKGITIDTGAFFGCSALSSITLPAVSSLSDFVLTNTSSIENITLPASLTSLGENAMAGMTSLTNIDASALSSVPTPGEDVWRNVEQGSVFVETTDATKASFKAADQWTNFKYDNTSTSADNLLAETADAKARFVGNDLQIQSTGCNITHVSVYDTAGITLTSLTTNSDNISINTSDFQTRIYIVNITLSNGKTATTKLIRK